MLSEYLPTEVNTGPWITAYTLEHLRSESNADYVLPICSMATPYQELAGLGDRLLPPLFHEALDTQLKRRIVSRIEACFPIYGDVKANSQRLKVIELPPRDLPSTPTGALLAFSVDTAVEEHGPHLPLGTDTIQSYSVLNALASEYASLELCRPLDYGQLTWGLPFGYSIDVTSELLTAYVRHYVAALTAWKKPAGIYVVDVHGSITHRQAIVAGLQASQFDNWTFRWLHEPLAEFASARGDQHAGGVETALVNRVNGALVDPAWWPIRIDDIAVGQMSFATAVELAADLEAFCRHVDQHSLNGIVGDINNFFALDADVLFQRMLDAARGDLQQLIDGQPTKAAGQSLW
jgi:creatinine amidohydrolase